MSPPVLRILVRDYCKCLKGDESPENIRSKLKGGECGEE
jgi:hypothetical protein